MNKNYIIGGAVFLVAAYYILKPAPAPLQVRWVTAQTNCEYVPDANLSLLTPARGFEAGLRQDGVLVWRNPPIMQPPQAAPQPAPAPSAAAPQTNAPAASPAPAAAAPATQPTALTNRPAGK